MQKFFFLILLLSLNISYAQINSPQASPRQTLLQKVGLVDVKIDYSRPSKRDRNIFGDVQYNIKTGSKNDLKIIDVKVEERPTGEISAGAGIGTDGGTIAFDISENNWLGEGKKVGFNVELSDESLKGRVNYTNPNYDYLK